MCNNRDVHKINYTKTTTLLVTNISYHPSRLPLNGIYYILDILVASCRFAVELRLLGGEPMKGRGDKNGIQAFGVEET